MFPLPQTATCHLTHFVTAVEIALHGTMSFSCVERFCVCAFCGLRALHVILMLKVSATMMHRSGVGSAVLCGSHFIMGCVAKG